MKKNVNPNPEIGVIMQVENKYGIFTFRRALIHLINVGVQNLTEENAAETQCDIERCAAELSKCGIWNLVTYIKKYVAVE